MKKITNLEIGGVYRGKTPDEFIYLGNFDTISIDTKAELGLLCNKKVTAYKEMNNHMLFIERHNHQGRTVEEIIKTNTKSHAHGIIYLCKFKKSHSFLEKVDQVNAFDILKYVDDLNASDKFKNEYSLEYLSPLHLIRHVGTPIRIPAPFQALFSSATKA